METRESYHDYMGRKMREQWRKKDTLVDRTLAEREIAEMQKQVHGLQMRVITLHEVVDDLSYKVNLLGGNPNQLEMKL